jgi:hypothetical protein
VSRGRDRVVHDRERLHQLLQEALIAHIGLVADGHPVVLPVAFAFDLDGPDEGGTLYIHGSVAAGWLRRSKDATVCVTLTEVDGLVAARSAFHHSMNYRSAVVIGRARVVSDPDEKVRALGLTIDHMIPGRFASLRPSTRKELAATAVLAVPLLEASMKVRAGDPVDDPEDVSAGVWGGVIPILRIAGIPVSANDSHPAVPADVVRRAEGLHG